jgi:molybdopterin-guanine dinucleotide biosynthesis protein A
MSEFEGFILVGGLSRRMGRDKARLEIVGQDFVTRIAAALSSLTERLSVVGSRYDEGVWPFPNVPDLYPQWGALGGLHAGLSACQAEWAAVVACDLPFVTQELFERLSKLRENYDAVVPIQTDGKQQPLCALYRAKCCRSKVEELILRGERRPRALLEEVKTRFVGPGEWNDLSNADSFFDNINTPEDFAAAIAKRNLPRKP